MARDNDPREFKVNYLLDPSLPGRIVSMKVVPVQIDHAAVYDQSGRLLWQWDFKAKASKYNAKG